MKQKTLGSKLPSGSQSAKDMPHSHSHRWWY